MKVKSDFITNSSSTIYMMIFSEEKPIITLKDMATVIGNYVSEKTINEKSISCLINLYQKSLQKTIDKMFTRYETIYEEDYNDHVIKELQRENPEFKDWDFYDPSPFAALVDIIYNKNLCLDATSTSGEGSTMICIVDRERVKKILGYENKS